jgi:hypothetical protein
MNSFERGQFVETDGLLAVVVGTPSDGGAPEDHLSLWFGEPRSTRKSEGGAGPRHPEVWTVPVELCNPAPSPVIRH